MNLILYSMHLHIYLIYIKIKWIVKIRRLRQWHISSVMNASAVVLVQENARPVQFQKEQATMKLILTAAFPVVHVQIPVLPVQFPNNSMMYIKEESDAK